MHETLLCSPAGDSNANHFLVATQDRGLQRRVTALPAGAVRHDCVLLACARSLLGGGLLD